VVHIDVYGSANCYSLGVASPLLLLLFEHNVILPLIFLPENGDVVT